MALPNRASLKRRPALVELVTQVVADLWEYLPPKDASEVLASLTTRPKEEALSLISAKLDVAESANVDFLQLAAWRQIVACFNKNSDAPGSSPRSRREAALEKFAASERKCKRTNRRLAFYSNHEDRMSTDILHLVRRTRDIISDIMGPLGVPQLLRIAEGSGFGPGFTFSSDGTERKNLYFKVSSDHTVTRDALPYLKQWMKSWPHWKSMLLELDPGFDIVRGNRVTTVPKNSETDRTIAIEPSFNVFMQKGVDWYLKKRLRRHGVDLQNQELNHTPARLASMRPLYAATIDISSASDCVSTGVIDYLFPADWCVLLDDLRSREYTLDKGRTWHTYEKFSSMGNAFTFPIESVLFYACAKACVVDAGESLEALRVYGDDIIIPPGAYCTLVELLRFLGFSPNLDKSFAFGWFRETCGSDFYSGVDLRPVYVKCIPRNDMEIFNLHNRFLWNRVGFRLVRTCTYLRDLVKRVLYGPAELPPGDEYLKWYRGNSIIYDHWFHAPSDYGSRFLSYNPDWQCLTYRFKSLRLKPKRLDTSNWTLQFWYLAFLLGVPGTHVESNSRFQRVYWNEETSFWPDPPWQPYLHD